MGELDKLRAENERLTGWLRENKAEAQKAWTEVERLRGEILGGVSVMHALGHPGAAEALRSALATDEEDA